MRLTFDAFDGRSYCRVPVIDADTHEVVGMISSNGAGEHSSGGIDVRLSMGNTKSRSTVTSRCRDLFGAYRPSSTMVPGIWRAPSGVVGGPALSAENELASISAKASSYAINA